MNVVAFSLASVSSPPGTPRGATSGAWKGFTEAIPIGKKR